jgi:hypothetical protein
MSNALSLPSIGFASDVALDLPDDLDAAQWREAGLQIARTRGATQWWIGDWWAFGEARYGDRKALVEAEDWDGPKFQTCVNASNVAKSFETNRRRLVLAFSHHAEVAAMPAEWQDKLLDEAEAERLSVMALRQRVKEVRAFLAQGWTPDQLARRAEVEAGRSVLANQTAGDDGNAVDRALIEWADAAGLLVRIDRSGPWGNVYHIPEDGDRAAVIEGFELYFERKLGLQKRIDELVGRVLACWCYPLDCHGSILICACNEDHG